MQDELEETGAPKKLTEISEGPVPSHTLYRRRMALRYLELAHAGDNGELPYEEEPGKYERFADNHKDGPDPEGYIRSVLTAMLHFCHQHEMEFEDDLRVAREEYKADLEADEENAALAAAGACLKCGTNCRNKLKLRCPECGCASKIHVTGSAHLIVRLEGTELVNEGFDFDRESPATCWACYYDGIAKDFEQDEEEDKEQFHEKPSLPFDAATDMDMKQSRFQPGCKECGSQLGLICTECHKKTYASAREFVEQVARLVKDGEYLDKLHPEWDMPSDDVFDCLHRLIDKARDITGYDATVRCERCGQCIDMSTYDSDAEEQLCNDCQQDIEDEEDTE